MSALIASFAESLPNSQETFQEIIGQEFVDDGQNTVHEWVYDFLLAVEEGDEELLGERLQELQMVDAGNRAVLLRAGVKLAKELGRDRQWQTLKGRLNRITSIPASFSFEAAQGCELTQQRNAEKVQNAGNRSVTEWLMSNTAFKTAFVLAAGLPVASATRMAMNVCNSTWSNASCALTDVAKQSIDLIALPPRDFRQELFELTNNSLDTNRSESKRVASLMRDANQFKVLQELLPHLFANSIVSPDDLWNYILKDDLIRYSLTTRQYKLILESGGGLPKLGLNLETLLASQDYDTAELFLDYGADPMPILENLKQQKLTKVPLKLLEKLLKGFEKIPERLHQSLEHCFLYKYKSVANSQDDIDVEKISNAWLLFLHKGLPFDLGRFLELASLPAYQQKFLGRVLGETSVEVNAVERNGKTFFENVLTLGNFELTTLTKQKGGYTKRPVIAMITDYSRDGIMYLAAAKTLMEKGAIVVPLTVPIEALDNTKYLIKRDYQKDPRGVLNSGHAEVEAIITLARNALRGVDAIWISGGSNVAELWYKDNDSSTYLARDVLEIAVLHLQSQEPYKPLIGVCRGHQMINVFYGGTLRDLGERDSGVPLVVEKRNGLLGSSFPDKATGWSHHYQSVDQVADMFEPVVKSAGSQAGMVKAIQPKTKELPLFGIQFHPEYVSDPDLAREHVLQLFLNMAKASKENTCFEPEFDAKAKCRPANLR